MMTVADMSKVVAQVDVSEADVVSLAIGQTAQIVIDAIGEKPAEGHVVEIGSSGRKDPGTGVVRFKVKIAIEHPDPSLHPSMTAKVTVLTANHADVVSVPIQAVVKRRVSDDGRELDEDKDKVAFNAASDHEVVYTLEGGKAKVTPVTTGTADEVRVEITDGIAEGAPVIAGPYRTLKELHDGAFVKADAAPSPTPSPSSSSSKAASSAASTSPTPVSQAR
jgi:HlyD family secretion protein